MKMMFPLVHFPDKKGNPKSTLTDSSLIKRMIWLPVRMNDRMYNAEW